MTEDGGRRAHHRDTEDTEKRQKNSVRMGQAFLIVVVGAQRLKVKGEKSSKLKAQR